MTKTELIDKLEELSKALEDPEKGDAAYLDFIVLENKHRSDIKTITDPEYVEKIRNIYLRMLDYARKSTEKDLKPFLMSNESADESDGKKLSKTIEEAETELHTIFDEIENKLKHATTAEEILMLSSDNSEINQRLQKVVTKLFLAMSKKTGIGLEITNLES